MKLHVRLNGTSTNPFAKFGMLHNPFPQSGRMEFAHYELQVQKLGGEPIPDTDYIREVLKGFSPEFVDLCCQLFRKGHMVKFDVEFPDPTLS